MGSEMCIRDSEWRDRSMPELGQLIEMFSGYADNTRCSEDPTFARRKLVLGWQSVVDQINTD